MEEPIVISVEAVGKVTYEVTNSTSSIESEWKAIKLATLLHIDAHSISTFCHDDQNRLNQMGIDLYIASMVVGLRGLVESAKQSGAYTEEEIWNKIHARYQESKDIGIQAGQHEKRVSTRGPVPPTSEN